MLVEDEPIVRFDLAEALAAAGYFVVDFGEAPSAWNFLTVNTVDLLITDIQMPGAFDGLELAKRARELCTDLPILIVSASPANSLGEWESCLISKPVRAADLLDQLQRILQSGARPAIQMPQPPAM